MSNRTLSQATMSYAERNAFLAKIGYTSYATYRLSPLWKFIRGRVFEQKGSECFLCHKKAEMIHHQHYSEANLRGQSLHGMKPICGECHEAIETRNGIKLLDIRDVHIATNERRRQMNRHSGIHGPALPQPPPGPNAWESRQKEAQLRAQRKLEKQNSPICETWKPGMPQIRKVKAPLSPERKKLRSLKGNVKSAQGALSELIKRNKPLDKAGKALRNANAELKEFLRINPHFK